MTIKVSRAVVAFVMLCGTGVAAENIRIGTEGAYPPFNFINDSGDLDGLEKEFGDELCARLKVTCDWVVNDWDTMIPNLVNSNCDLIVASMSITEAREAVIDFSENYLPADPSGFVAMRGADDMVVQGNVAAQTSTTHADFVASSEATLVEFSMPDETIAAVRNGEVDAVFADKNFLSDAVSNSDGELVFVGDTVTLGRGAGVGLRKSDQDMRARVNDAVMSMKSDGTINGLIEKWLGPEATKY